MKKIKINQVGSHLIALALLVCVGGLIVLIGVKVFGGQKLGVNNKTEAQNSSATQPTIAVPAGWKLLADHDVGVQFVYPASAGEFTRPSKPSGDFASELVSGNISANYVPGVTGAFTLGSYKTINPEINSRSFGPKIRLNGNEWVVTQPNQYDATLYHKGDVYGEMKHNNTRGIDVYTATSGNEGVVQYSLYFVVNGKLCVLELPPFNSDLDSSTYNVNDQAPYDTMYAQIRDSISLY